MRVCLVNPAWSFDGSIYFGCHAPHLPIEYGFAKLLLERAGHTVELLDAHADGLGPAALRARVEAFGPDMIVVTTAPSYLFWRCPPPELRVPHETLAALDGAPGTRVIVGPHGSTSPLTTARKLGVDAVVLGECEEVLLRLASTPVRDWPAIPSVALRREDGQVAVNGGPHTTDMQALPPLRWPLETLLQHGHHHHRFDEAGGGPGAEIEASRGCPYSCTFCAKETHRDRYRKRPLETVVEELDDLVDKGVEYVYFIDEILLPDKALIDALAARPLKFGIQTRIDLWSLDMLDRLGAAGCVSVEAGIESITVEGRAALDKRCKLDTDALTERLVRAKKSIAFVQATLMEARSDDPHAVAAWRDELRRHGVWANDPVPLFPYPGSPDYTKLWGAPDDQAWERAHDHYLGRFDRLSDIQDRKVVRLPVLEQGMAAGAKA